MTLLKKFSAAQKVSLKQTKFGDIIFYIKIFLIKKIICIFSVHSRLKVDVNSKSYSKSLGD